MKYTGYSCICMLLFFLFYKHSCTPMHSINNAYANAMFQTLFRNICTHAFSTMIRQTIFSQTVVHKRIIYKLNSTQSFSPKQSCTQVFLQNMLYTKVLYKIKSIQKGFLQNKAVHSGFLQNNSCTQQQKVYTEVFSKTKVVCLRFPNQISV